MPPLDLCPTPCFQVDFKQEGTDSTNTSDAADGASEAASGGGAGVRHALPWTIRKTVSATAPKQGDINSTNRVDGI